MNFLKNAVFSDNKLSANNASTKKITEIVKKAHSIAHYGIKKMWSAINEKYYAIKVWAVKTLAKDFMACRHNQSLKICDLIKSTTANKNWKRIKMDWVDLKNFAAENDNFKWIPNVIDVHSKFLFKMLSKTANKVTFSVLL